MLHGHVVLLGHLSGGGVHDSRRDGEVARGGDARSSKVHGGVRLEVGHHSGRVAVGKDDARRAGEVGRKVLDTGDDGFFGGLAEGADHHLGFGEEQTAPVISISSTLMSTQLQAAARVAKYIPTIRELLTHILQMAVAHVVHAKHKDMLVLRDGVANLGEELILVLAGLFGDLGHVDDL